MTGPGTLAAGMPAGEDALIRKVRDLEQQMRELACARSLGASTIGNGGTLTVDGAEVVNGSLTVLGTITTPGTLNSAGAINAGASLTAGTFITAGGNITSTGGALSVANSVNGASLSVTGAIGGASVATSGDVNASGQVVSAGPLKSPGSYAYTVHIGSWVAAWIDSDGTFGQSPSSSFVKTGLAQMTADDARKLLSLTPYWGRYVWDPDDIPPRVFFLAEDVQAAGFGPDVVPTVTNQPLSMLMPDGSPVLDASKNPVVIPVGHAFTVNYSQMVVPLVAAWQDGAQQMQLMRDQMAALQAKVDALTA